jgi:hypothetical protein
VRLYREDAVMVAINFSEEPFDGRMEVPQIFRSKNGQLKLKPLFPGKPLKAVTAQEASLFLPPWGYQVWAIK